MFLGINAYSHDASAALITREGEILAAVEEERFSRLKKESRFPVEAIKYCLKAASLDAKDISAIGYAWHPLLLLRDRVVRSNLCAFRVSGALIWKNLKKAYSAAHIRSAFEAEIGDLSRNCRVHFFRHHAAHVASAFHASPFEDSAFLTLDGRGEWESGTCGVVTANAMTQLSSIRHPNSLGNFYTGFARFCGFENADKDGVAMAFAATGKPTFRKKILAMLAIEDRTPMLQFSMPRKMLDCRSGDAQPTEALEKFLEVKRRLPNGPILFEHRDISASVQAVLEEIILDGCQRLQERTGQRNVVMAGGVFLNSVANGRIQNESGFRSFFIQPAAHDAGLSLGCCFLLANQIRPLQSVIPKRFSSLLGPEFSRTEILSVLESTNGIVWSQPESLVDTAAEAIAGGAVVGWFQGRMEFGPRALGNRSILANPRLPGTKRRLNEIKGREPFRPFAVSVLQESASDWFVQGTESPYMLLVDRFHSSKAAIAPSGQHVDGSVRVQTVREEDNPMFRRLIRSFERRSGIPFLINTSLNVRGEPLACTPSDAVSAFLTSEIDALGIGPFWLSKPATALRPSNSPSGEPRAPHAP
jgi:carbamoyltransferase